MIVVDTAEEVGPFLYTLAESTAGELIETENIVVDTVVVKVVMFPRKQVGRLLMMILLMW